MRRHESVDGLQTVGGTHSGERGTEQWTCEGGVRMNHF